MVERLPPEEHKAAVRALPCCAPGCGSTRHVVSHHRTGGGMGAKVSDYDTMPLCWACHGHFHGLNGVFKGWKKERLREWQREMVKRTMEAIYGAGREER